MVCMASSSTIPFAAFNSSIRLAKATKKKALARPCMATHRDPLPPQKVEIFRSMENWATENVLPLLKPVSKSWQPQQFLPNPSSEGFTEQVKELRERTKEIPDEYFVVLVGDMITEEALPTYQAHFSTTQAYGDSGCTGDTPWAVWTRGWSAEENRHGDLLNKYLYLSGRVDMVQVEKTIHHLIRSGMDIGTENNPYLWTIYTSFQERATFVSHGNTAKLAMQHGDTKLAQICGVIAADEKRHEQAYTRIVKKLFEVDPDETMVAFANMMRKKIRMPAHFMYDDQDRNLFAHFSNVASRIGVYNTIDYIEILEHLVVTWNVEKLRTGLSWQGRKAQDYVCSLAPRLRKMEERAHRDRGRAKSKETSPSSSTLTFSWIFNRAV